MGASPWTEEVIAGEKAVTAPDVVVVGGAPTGLMLAAELALAGTEVVIFERRSDQSVDGSRAGGLHARTLEVLDQRGVAERFVSAGQLHPFLGYGGTVLSLADMPTRHPHLLALWQGDIERILADWVLGDLGVQILRAREVVGLVQGACGSTSRCPTARPCERRTSSAATVGAARSARRRASSSPAWTPQPVG